MVAVIRTVVIGLALTGLAYVASSNGDGWVGFIGFLMLLFVPVVTTGVLAAKAADAWFDRHDRRTAVGSASVGRRRRGFSGRSCGTCRARLIQIDTFWICETCDQVAVAL